MPVADMQNCELCTGKASAPEQTMMDSHGIAHLPWTSMVQQEGVHSLSRAAEHRLNNAAMASMQSKESIEVGLL